MTRDIVLVTVECARWDYRNALDLPSELNATRGVTAAHYTRPSMAGLLTGEYASVADAHAHGPTLADVLSNERYHTAAVSYSPQTTAAFGFETGFDEHWLLSPDDGPLSRGSKWREWLGESAIVRRIKNRVTDKQATFEHIPTDQTAVDKCRDILDRTRRRPLFLWAHLMGSHRPYAWGDDALPASVSRAADRGDKDVHDEVERHYYDGLRRVGDHVSSIVATAPDDALIVVTGDHGEELGEDGYFFHGGYRRRLVDTLIDVPVFCRGRSLPDGVSLIDLPAYLTGAVGISAPSEWDARQEREHALSIAPWNDKASVRYQSDSVDLTFADAECAHLRDVNPTPEGVKDQLEALGYSGVG